MEEEKIVLSKRENDYSVNSVPSYRGIMNNRFYFSEVKNHLILKRSGTYRAPEDFDVASSIKEADLKLYEAAKKSAKIISKNAGLKFVDKTPQASQLELKFE